MNCRLYAECLLCLPARENHDIVVFKWKLYPSIP